VSSSRYLRRESARKCPAHQAILEEALDQLAEYGYFSKDDIVTAAGFPTQLSDSYLRWDYIIEFLKEDGDCELIPLAARFWKMKPNQRMLEPEKAIAGGHGKKTAGYALVSVDNGALAVKRLAHKRSLANGVGKAFRKYADALVKRDLLAEPETRKLANTVTN